MELKGRIKRRVVIVDDSRTMQTMLETAFGDRPDFKVVGVAGDATSAAELVRKFRPDLVTIDLCLPYIDGVGLLRMISDLPNICKVIVSDQLAKSVLMQAKLEEFGASACLSKRGLVDDPENFFGYILAACERNAARVTPSEPQVPSTVIHLPSVAIRTPFPSSFPIPRDESARISLLRRKQLANAERERSFDLITQHVAETMGFPVCLLTFIDRDTQWIKSAYGFQELKMPREDAFCNYTILDDCALIVSNAANDNRFATNRLVVGEPRIRSYIGQPIVTRDGTRIGALCVLDTKARQPNKPLLATLAAMANVVAEMIEARPLVA